MPPLGATRRPAFLPARGPVGMPARRCHPSAARRGHSEIKRDFGRADAIQADWHERGAYFDVGPVKGLVR